MTTASPDPDDLDPAAAHLTGAVVPPAQCADHARDRRAVA